MGQRFWVAVLTKNRIGNSVLASDKKIKIFDTLEKAKQQKQKWIDENSEWIAQTREQEFCEIEEHEFEFYIMNDTEDEFWIEIYAIDAE